MKNLLKPSPLSAGTSFWLVFLLINFLLPQILYAQPERGGSDAMQNWQIRFEGIGLEQGLPHKTVSALCQDSLGFIWMGTRTSLVKYDGYSFSTYRYRKPGAESGKDSEISINVTSIMEAPGGDLIVGCKRGDPLSPRLFRFHRKTEQLEPLFSEPDTIFQARIWDLRIYEGYLWIHSHRLFRLAVDKLSRSSSVEMEWLEDAFDGRGRDPGLGGRGFLDRDKQGRYWIPAVGGMYQWKPTLDSFIFNEVPKVTWKQVYPKFPPFLINMEEDINGHIMAFPRWGQGYFNFDPESGSWEAINEPNCDYYLHKIDLPRIDQVWMGLYMGNGGLNILDTKNRQVNRVDIQVNGQQFLPFAQVQSMLQDRSGSLWVGLLGGPLLRHDPIQAAFHWHQFQPNDPSSLKHDVVTGIGEDQSGDYWVATYGGGLHQWDRRTNRFKRIAADPSGKTGPIRNKLSALTVASDGKIWFGMGFNPGYLEPKTGRYQYYENPGVTMTIFEDSHRNIWLAKNGRGLAKFEPTQDEFRDIGIPRPTDSTKFSYPPMSGIMEDSRGKLWIGSHSTGIGFYRFDPITESFQAFRMPEAHHFFEDRKGFIWMGSQDGLLRYDQDSSTFKHFGREEGLLSLSIGAITEDQMGRLWMATDNGITSLDQSRTNFQHYTPSQGLANYHFKTCVYQNQEGEICFGGNQGILAFHPDSVKRNEIVPDLAFTRIDLEGKTLSIGEDDILTYHPSFTKELHLAHHQNDLTLHYAALHFKQPEKNRYQIMLQPEDKNWRDVGNLRSANYTNLKPGKYQFKVKAANADGFWNQNPITLDINIAPPWYWNIFSQFFYLLTALSLLFVLYNFQLNRRLAEAEAYRLSELDRVKTQLYTNITHEFRTPLTVILGMADQALQDPTKWFRQGLSLIKRNGERLLVLVNQLLDLDKIKAGKLVLEPVQGDIIAYLEQIVGLFQDFAKTKNIRLQFLTEIPRLDMDFDPEKLHTIVGNLLGNAMKFTSQEGVVYLKVRRHELEDARTYCQIRVVDNGMGIPDGEQALVFDRFYQVDGSATREQEGTGIGLTLVKELVQLLRGNIKLESTLGMGTTFIVELPITQNAPKSIATTVSPSLLASSLEQPGPEGIAVAEEERDEGKPQILLVEDNVDILQYLQSCLMDSYSITVAADGLKGQAMAIEQVPDLIVSDIMMPGKNGIELLQELKNDERTSHIPVILLTAKADISSKLEGLAHGADAYLVKPFHPAELEIRIRKLIDLRKQLQQYYNGTSLLQEEVPANLEKEDRFLQRVRAVVAQQMEQEGFGVAELCQALSLSRSQLHRKLKALTGKPASKVIRSIKMVKAKELLLNSNKNVTEVGYAVGYSNRSHFTQEFNAEFGRPPSYFRP